MPQQNDLPMLTANGRRLTLKLADLPRDWVTAASLVEAIGVSRRTVLRELPGVEQWMSAAGFKLVRSPGQGILLEESEPRRAELRRLAAAGSAGDALPREERRQRLLCTLLAAEQPVKTYALAYDLQVSEHTLAADLEVYQVGNKLLELGVIQSRDMTSEAAMTKLMWAIGQGMEPEEIRALFEKNLAGEITAS